MGNIAAILHNSEVPKPMFNDRFCVEFAENVHLHYRNVRLEFYPQEFCCILEAMRSISTKEVLQFAYNNGDLHKVITSATLPEESEFDTRLQIELQQEGHFHVHYRNLRVELKALDELGLSHSPIPADPDWLSAIDVTTKRFAIKRMSTENMLARIWNGEEYVLTEIRKTPHFDVLEGRVERYEKYAALVNEAEGREVMGFSKFEKLIESLLADGVILDHLIVVDNQGGIWDGLHRAAYLEKHYSGATLPVLVMSERTITGKD